MSLKLRHLLSTKSKRGEEDGSQTRVKCTAQQGGCISEGSTAATECQKKHRRFQVGAQNDSKPAEATHYRGVGEMLADTYKHDGELENQPTKGAE